MKKSSISPELLQKIKDSISILEVIGEHVVLRKSGANYVGLCPFHSERSPSFSVSETKQLYHCYGCRRGGDLVTFVMEILGVSFVEAVEELADRARVPMPAGWGSQETGPEVEKLRSAQKEKLALAYKLNRFAASYFHQNLSQKSQVREYLAKRGVTSDLSQSFYLGAASDSWDDFSHFLTSKKAPLEMAAELGLIRPSTKPKAGRDTGYFDLFRGRVIFPILNLRGKVAGFGGRTLGDESPKYLNSPESLTFQKGKLAFGLYQAQKYIREKGEIVLVEGYFDVLALHAAGFQNVVATCGTALTPDHLNLFKRFANKLTVLFDGDKAGIAATERAMEVGLDQGWVLFGAQMPDGLDPDELVLGSSLNSGPNAGPGTGLKTGLETGKERMSAVLKEAKPLLDHRLEEAIQSAQGGPEELSQSLKQIGKWLARFQDPIGREVRVQDIQKRLGVSPQLLQNAMGLPHEVGKRTPTVQLKPPPSRPKVRNAVGRLGSEKPSEKLGPTDRILLTGIVYGDPYTEIFTQIRGNLPPESTLGDLIDHPEAREFVEKSISNPGAIEKFWNEIEDKGGLNGSIRTIMTETLLSEHPPVASEEFRGALFRSLYKTWARFSQRIKKAIEDAEVKKDAELQTRWMKEYLDVQRKMKEFSSFYDEE